MAGFDLERKEEVVRLGMEAIQEGKGELDYEKRRRGRESKSGEIEHKEKRGRREQTELEERGFEESQRG